MNITTKNGDKGSTLFKTGKMDKSDPRIDFVGSIDELQVAIGGIEPENEETAYKLRTIQETLFNIYPDKITPQDIKNLEDWQEELTKSNNIFYDWNLTTPKTYRIDSARVIARKTERKYVRLKKYEELNENNLQYLNRLSDFLWILGRKVESLQKKKSQ